MGCVFCNIVQGKAPASVVYSDEKVKAFMDIQPVNSGHVLVIPKAHAKGLSELDEETGAHIFKIAMGIANALRKTKLRCEGINLLLSDGKAASQEIFHLHLHIIPRFRGDGFGFKFAKFYQPDRATLDKIAKEIREAM
jgi:histidine triad (HIT) family protein